MSQISGEVVVGRQRVRIYSGFHEELGAADAELRRTWRGDPLPLHPLRVRYEEPEAGSTAAS